MKRWINWIVLVLVFAIACGFLANWQLARRETRLASIALVQRNYDAEPVLVDQLIFNSSFQIPQDTWRPVFSTGHYLPEKALLVRNRPNNGTGGFEELVPFVTTSGNTIFVSRGWIPTGERQNYPDEVPLPNSDEVTITGRVVAEEPVLDRGAPAGQVASINIELAADKAGLGEVVTSGYVRLVSETPKSSVTLQSMPGPATEEGNNLSYAVQWIIFAAMAIAALIWRVRRDRLTEAGKERTRKISRSKQDEDFEDSMTER